MNQYSINRTTKSTFAQIKKHVSQLTQHDISAIKSKLSKVNVNNIKISRHAMSEHIKLDYKDIRRCFRNYNIIEFNITYKSETPNYRVLIRSKETINTILDNKLTKMQICIVYDITENIVVSVYLNKEDDSHETLNLDRYSNITVDIASKL